jgi:hypothetical protein
MIRFPWLLITGLALVGCSNGREELTRELNQLQRELARVRASNSALQDRVEALEQRRERTAEASDEPDKDDRPALEVVRIEPDSAKPSPEEPVSDEDDRPVIRNGFRGRVEMSDAPPQAAKSVLPQRR